MTVDLGKVDGQNWSAADVDALEAAINLGVNVCTSGTRPGSPATGTTIFETDTGDLRIWTGSVWSAVAVPAVGAANIWTPTVTQSGSVTVSVTRAGYQRVGRFVTCNLFLGVTGAGTGANAVVIGGLPFTATGNQGVIGTGAVLDQSAAFTYPGFVLLNTTSSVVFIPTGTSTAGQYLGVASFTAALAVNDSLYATFTYEAAADA